MDILKKLKHINSNKPYNGLTLLTEGYHQIICFRFVKSKFTKKDGEEDGKSILVELEREVIFLPQYFNASLNEDDIDALNKSSEKIYLYFGGRKEKSR